MTLLLEGKPLKEAASALIERKLGSSTSNRAMLGRSAQNISRTNCNSSWRENRARRFGVIIERARE